MTDDDFGFSFHDTSEIAKPLVEIARSSGDTYAVKVTGLVNMIMPLLNNLKKNPEKDVIKWPNRVEVINAFIKKMDEYVKS